MLANEPTAGSYPPLQVASLASVGMFLDHSSSGWFISQSFLSFSRDGTGNGFGEPNEACEARE